MPFVPATLVLVAFLARQPPPAAPSAPRPAPADCLATMHERARWLLPSEVTEASGLALGRAGSLWVHGDERADLVQVDPTAGRVLARVALDSRTRRGDFEGVATSGDTLFLVTSDGLLLRATLPVGAPPPRVAGLRADTRLGRWCEIEGLEAAAEPGILLLACKTPRRKQVEGTMTLLRWDLDAGRLAVPDRIAIASTSLGERQFRTSGLTRDPVSGQFALVSAIDNRLAILAANGTPLGSRLLGDRHRQPEGIAWLPDGRLVLVDEGGSTRATLTVYQCQA